jgi:hypothetical protein
MVDTQGTSPRMNAEERRSAEFHEKAVLLREPRAQSGLIPGGRVLVDHVFPDRLIDLGYTLGELGFGLGGVARLEGRPELAQCGAQTGGVGAVLRRSFGGLPGALQRRKMVCHAGLVFLLGLFPKDLFYWGLEERSNQRIGSSGDLAIGSSEVARRIVEPIKSS